MKRSRATSAQQFAKQLPAKLKNLLWRRRTIDYLVLLFAIAFSWWLMSSTFGYEDGRIVIAGKLYSDFGAHMPLIRSFSMGWNIPPEYPFFVGEPIRYHYLFYALVGLLERIGFRLDMALNIPSAFGLSLLLFMIYLYGKTLFGRRAAGIIALFLFLFNGSLAFVEYFNQQGWTWAALTTISEQLHFASFGPWSGRLVSAFWNWNVLTNQRHLALGYGLVLLVVFPLIVLHRQRIAKARVSFITKLRSLLTGFAARIEKQLPKHSAPIDTAFYKKHWLWILVICFTMVVLPILHQAAFTIAAPLIVMWVALTWPKSKPWLPVYFAALVLGSLSFFFLTVGSSQPLQFEFGFLAVERTPVGILTYWFYNLGAYLVLLPFLLIWSIKYKQWWLLTILPFFIAANVLRLSVDMINNHKLITFFLIGVNITTAGFIVWSWRWWIGKLVTPFLILVLTFSGIIDMFPVINDTTGTITDYPQSTIIRWIRDNTEPNAQFVTASYMYSPASMAGRFLFLDYGYHAWSMGYNDRDKRSDLPQIWSATITQDEWCEVVQRHGIDYLLVGPGEAAVEDGTIDVSSSRIVREWPVTFASTEGWSVWRVANLCPSTL